MPIWIATVAKAIGIKGFISIALGIALIGAWILHKHDSATIERLRQEKADLIAASKVAGEQQKQLNTAKQTQYDTAAKDSEHEKALTDTAVRAAVAEFARTHRVPEGASCASGGTVTAPESGGAGVAESLPAHRDVLVSEPDLRTLSDASSYAVSCRALVLDLAK